MVVLRIGGHRGSGQTDHAAASPEEKAKPAENTIASIQQAIEAGAELIEVDVMLSADGEVVVTHTNLLEVHVLHPDMWAKCDPARPYVSQYTLNELRGFGVGPRGDGQIPTLCEVLALMQSNCVLLNIELKGRQGTDDLSVNKNEAKSLVVSVVDVINAATVEKERVILSSFAVSVLEEAKRVAPDIKRAMLYVPPTDAGAGRRVFHEQSRPTDSSVYEVLTCERLIALHQQLGLSFIHPEVTSLQEAHLQTIVQHDMRAPDGALLGIHTWSLGRYDQTQGWCVGEPLPRQQKVLSELAGWAKKYISIPFGVITNHVPAMIEWRREMSFTSSLP